MVTLSNTLIEQGAGWDKRLINPYGTGEILADTRIVRPIQVRDLDAAKTLIQQLQSASDEAVGEIVTGIPANFRVTAARAVDRGVLGAFVVVTWERNDAPVHGFPLPSPDVYCGMPQIEAVNFPVVKYNPGDATKYDLPSGDPTVVSYMQFYKISTPIRMGAWATGPIVMEDGHITNKNTFYGLKEESVLYVGKTATSYDVGGTRNTLYWFNYIYSRWFGTNDTSIVVDTSGTLKLGLYDNWRINSDATVEIQHIEAPASGFPYPI